MKARPWIWVILANLIFITGIVTLAVIAVKNPQPQVPVAHGR